MMTGKYDSTDSMIEQSARALTAGLAGGTLSSRELLETYITRIEKFNPDLNAVVALNLKEARRQADEADQATARGESFGVLHGLPLTIKDTYEVPGMPCTAGSPELRNHRPAQAAYAVQRLMDEGAIIFGKTNVPCLASDIQTYNEVYGTTNHPQNVSLSPGGSSGGAAAALASGLTPLELGSDIGGSIRIPAHFCGVYGHKTSHGIISLRGHIPGNVGSLAEPELAVAGPMARSAGDLRLMLDVLAGPPPELRPGWQLDLPEEDRDNLQDFRVLLWTEDTLGDIEPAMADVYQDLHRKLVSAGASVEVGAPPGWSLKRVFDLYAMRLSAKMMSGASRWERQAMGLVAPVAGAFADAFGGAFRIPAQTRQFLAGANLRYADWLVAEEKCAQLREEFIELFQQYDVILMPPTLTTALPHDHGRFMGGRKVVVDKRKRPYMDLFSWIAPATLLGLPATSAPVGQTPEGLPVNVQIVGAPYRDRSTIRFAGLLS